MYKLLSCTLSLLALLLREYASASIDILSAIGERNTSTLQASLIQKHKLVLGQYLVPAKDKITLENWTNPTINDYRIVQNYLSYAYRPELRYLNDWYSQWREKRIRNFKLITETQNPEFHIEYLNSDPHDKENCIIVYISFNEAYRNSLYDLIEQLWKIGFKGHLIYRMGGWPYTEGHSLELFDVPYAFKIFSFLEAQHLGYKNCLWLDACFYPLQSLDPIFTHIANHGVFFHTMPMGYTQFNHIPSFATYALGNLSIAEFLELTPVSTAALGLDVTSSRGRKILDRWLEMAKNKIGFLSYIPEMAPWYVLAKEFQLLPYADKEFIALDPKVITPATLLFWNHREPNP